LLCVRPDWGDPLAGQGRRNPGCSAPARPPMRAPDELRALVEQGLADLTPTASLDGLFEAMRYALAGRRNGVRPVLCLATAEAAGGRAEDALPAAVALELV